MSTPKYERLPTDTSGNSHIRDEDQVELENVMRIDTIPKRSPLSKMVLHMAIGSLGLIVLYLSLSICLTFYQSWLIKRYKFPLTIVLYHLIIKLMFSTLLRYIYRVATGKSRVLLDWRTSFKKISPTGIASGIDIGFSNWGLELVKISLYTMTKSSTIIFILFFAILLGLEKKSWSLVAIVAMIATGLFMFTYKSTEFDVFGFAFLLFASFTSGIRWSFAQLIMQKSKLGLHNPIDMIFHMQPWMIISIIPFTIGFEGKQAIDLLQQISTVPYTDILLVFTKITVGAMIAFAMEVSEFMVLSHTSSLTLSISGIFKDIFQLVLAVEVLGDQLSPINIMGLVLCLCGICCHVAHKYTTYIRMKSEEVFIVNNDSMSNNISTNVKFRNNTAQSIPLLDSNDLNNSDSEGSHNSDNQNASDVIFDILKRRDASRR